VFKSIKVYICFILLGYASGVYTQQVITYSDSRIITTGVPFLLLNTDAASLGMGDMGVATLPDTYSQQWNAAKYVFAEKDKGIGLSYAPYLSRLVNDMFLANVTGFSKLRSRHSAWAASFTYFNVGNINLSAEQGEQLIPQGSEHPYEFFADLSYGLPLSERMAMAVTARYIRSDLAIRTRNELNRAWGLAFDISGFYTSKELLYNTFIGKYRIGFQISNIGQKLKYKDVGRDFFLPTNLKIGLSYDFILPEYTFSLAVEAKKLLVPTPPKYGFVDANGNGVQDADEPTFITAGRSNDVSFLTGMFQSFTDAPNGFKEEWQEIAWSVGGSFTYEDFLTVRSGFFYENPVKGSRKYFTLGVGVRVNRFSVDAAYLFSVSQVENPFEKSLKLSLCF
jgi:hypothetical protein